MSNNSSPTFVQLSKEDDHIVSHYGVHYEKKNDTINADQMYENEINKWHKQKYQEDPILDISYETNNTTIQYNTQFLTCQIEIIEGPLSLNGFIVEGLQISTKVCPVFSREEGTDYIEILQLLQKIETKIYNDNKYANEEAEEEQHELCGIEYARDHC